MPAYDDSLTVGTRRIESTRTTILNVLLCRQNAVVTAGQIYSESPRDSTNNVLMRLLVYQRLRLVRYHYCNRDKVRTHRTYQTKDTQMGLGKKWRKLTKAAQHAVTTLPLAQLETQALSPEHSLTQSSRENSV